MAKKLIILDAGHGGVHVDYQTAGKRSPQTKEGQEFYEGVYNRVIVNEIAFELMLLGIDYTILAPENTDILLPSRVRRANDLNDEFSCFGLSIHSNAVDPPDLFTNDAKGWEIWTSIGETKSDKGAEIVANEISNEFPEYRIRYGKSGNVSKEKNFYILSRTKMPFMLAENLFMTNENELELLKNHEHRRRQVMAYVRSLECIHQTLM